MIYGETILLTVVTWACGLGVIAVLALLMFIVCKLIREG